MATFLAYYNISLVGHIPFLVQAVITCSMSTHAEKCDRLCENRKRPFKVFKVKLPAFARTRPLLFSRTGLSNLLNKIQFTFEVVPCLILGLFRRFF